MTETPISEPKEESKLSSWQILKEIGEVRKSTKRIRERKNQAFENINTSLSKIKEVLNHKIEKESLKV